jgi:hypothetical protein
MIFWRRLEMKLNKHYLNVIKLIKKNKPEDYNPTHGGLFILLFLNLFFGGCFMSHSNSGLEKRMDNLESKNEATYNMIRESLYLQKFYIKQTQPREKVRDIFDELKENL